MTKKELMEKLINPVVDAIKTEGLTADIDEIYNGDLMKFDKDLYHCIAAKLAPLMLSYIVNTTDVCEEEKNEMIKLTNSLSILYEVYLDKEDGDGKGGTT